MHVAHTPSQFPGTFLFLPTLSVPIAGLGVASHAGLDGVAWNACRLNWLSWHSTYSVPFGWKAAVGLLHPPRLKLCGVHGPSTLGETKSWKLPAPRMWNSRNTPVADYTIIQLRRNFNGIQHALLIPVVESYRTCGFVVGGVLTTSFRR